MPEEYQEPTKEIVMRRLEILPETIKKQYITVLNLQDEINSIEFDIKSFKNNIMQKVAAEIDGEGKQKYKTIQAREIEMDIRLANDDRYKLLSQNMAKNARRLKEKNIEIEFVNNKLKSARIMARLIGETEKQE